MFELKTKLNFSSSNPNNFCIVPSNTTTDKCTLVRDLCKLLQQRSSPHQVSSLPTLTELIFVSCRYFIPNDWK